MNRITFVLDSLDKAGANAMMTGMIRQLARTGDLTPLTAMFGGGGGGRGGAAAFGPPPPWSARPGEQGTPGAGGGRGGPPPAGGAAPGAAPGGAPAGIPDPSAFQQIMPLFDIPGRPSGGGGFGLGFLQTLGFGQAGFAAFAGGAAGVAPGDYVAVMTIGGKTLRQKIRVERAVPGGVY
jgi:hypothetical protein